MKKLFDKDELWFALVWILLYVIGFANADALSDSIGIPKLLTVLLGLVLIFVLLGFVKKHRLLQYYGLQPMVGQKKSYLHFLPLILISTVNLWHGFSIHSTPLEILLHILSMCCVGFLEELIFRGFLFKAMCKSSTTVAIIVSSITFGAGHMINLLLGAPLLDTLLQLVYASAIGFCYTALFFTGGSILPCILSHAFVNSTSIFAAAPSPAVQIIITLVQTVLGVGYGLWLLRKAPSA